MKPGPKPTPPLERFGWRCPDCGRQKKPISARCRSCSWIIRRARSQKKPTIELKGRKCSCGILKSNGAALCKKCEGIRKHNSGVNRLARLKHGHTMGPRTSPEYSAYNSMKQRCNNPRNPGYRLYGGRGICVSREWQDDFGAFIAHVGRRPSISHSLDRINNNGNYEPGNVRWATRTEQGMNRRTTTKFWRLDNDGVEAPTNLKAIAEYLRLTYPSLRSHFRHNGLLPASFRAT